jgi:phage repressor protein C with HTH and peptisase S24 domain
MTLSDRIRWAMNEAGITQVELARRVGIAPPSVHGWLTGKAKFLRGENLLLAARALNVNEDWLATGKGEPNAPYTVNAIDLMAALGAQSVAIADPDNPDLILIQKVKLKLSAGITGFETVPDRSESSMVTVPRRWIEKNDYLPERLVAIEIRGESMEPALYAGDTVIVNTADTKPVDGAVFAVNYEGEAVIKRLVRDHGMWWLASDHYDQRIYARKRCEGAMCIIVGRVVRRESERI